MPIPLFRRSAGLMPALFLLSLPLARTGIDTGSIEGRVRDGAGVPIASAHVVVTGTSRSALTDALGRYRISRVPAGNHALRAALTGYRSVQADVVVKTGETAFHDFTLLPATVEREDIAAAAPQAAVAPDDAATKQHVAGAAPSPRSETNSTGAGISTHGRRYAGIRQPHELPNTEDYRRIYDNRLLSARNNPLSTFSIDVDRASYSNVRRFLLSGQRPPADAVRIEEMVNYFPYAYAEPRGRHPFTVTTDIGPAPWNSAHRLVRIGLQGRRYAGEDLPPSNLVFLIDVSGSMRPSDRLPLVKQAFRLLVNELRAEDRVAIVVYAGSAGLVLPSTSGADKETILAAIDRLEAGGSTAGGAGIRLAYDMVRRNRIAGGNNRVILATDGDFNVGVSSEGELVRLIEERRREGAAITILGLGRGNLKDARMEQLADKGNGNYAYIDNLLEARKVFVTELTSTLFTIAKDVKLQVEFNPELVRSYRLIGYENRLLAREDFRDDTKDAGELGAGHSVTALYEIVPADAESDEGAADDDDSLRYQRMAERAGAHTDEWLTVRLRYKPPAAERSVLFRHTLERGDEVRQLRGDFAFAASVAAFGMVLRDSEHKGSATLGSVLDLARRSRGADADGYRAEFIRLVELAETVGVAVGED